MQEILLSDIYDTPQDHMGTMTLLGIEKALITDMYLE